MITLKQFYALLVSGLIVSCAHLTLTQLKPFKSAFPSQEWTDYALKQVQLSNLPALNPKDASEFCPQGMSVRNYVHLLVGIAKFESSFNPAAEYREAFNDRNGKPVISTGLLQLSKESANGYGCGIKSQDDLKDPYRNIDCGLKILERWIERDGVIASSKAPWKGGARYWSVLRYKKQKIQEFIAPWCE